MREILFRGKRIDNGEWVYGFLYESAKSSSYNAESYILEKERLSVNFKGDKGVTTYVEFIPVDLSTVGEYTGLTANGKKIFEGDILAVEQISDSIEHFESPVKCPYNVVVKWDKCSWMWETIGTARKRYLHFPEAWLFRKCEVIGNIHDNHELLEVRE